MFYHVHRLNVPWVDHRFIRARELVNSELGDKENMKFKKAILAACLYAGFSTPAYANEPEMVILPLLLFVYPVLIFMIFLLPLGLFRKVIALMIFFVLNIFITAGGFKFDSVKQEAFLFIAPFSTWILAVVTAFIFKKIHILDVPEEK
jgi:hypothetical protein